MKPKCSTKKPLTKEDIVPGAVIHTYECDAEWLVLGASTDAATPRHGDVVRDGGAFPVLFFSAIGGVKGTGIVALLWDETTGGKGLHIADHGLRNAE